MRRHRKTAIFSLVLVLALFGYGNYKARKGGMLDNAFLNREDVFYRMDSQVNSRRNLGFDGTEFIPIILKFPEGIQTKKDLEKILRLHEKAEEIFPGRVLSLANAANYKDTGEGLLDLPYICPETLNQLSISSWKEEVASDKGVYGVLVARDFTWASIAIYLPPDYDEMMEEAWKIIELVEGRKPGPLERFWKKDIEPADPDIIVGGWVIGRWTMSQALNRDMVSLIFLGIVFSFFVFSQFVPARQAVAAALLVVAPSLFMARGSVGLLELLGLDVRERVFILLTYANCIVQGISFSLHKLEGLNRAGGHDRETGRLILVTSAISIMGFATLYSFRILGIREMGLISAIGVLYLYILSTILPVFCFPAKAKEDNMLSRATESLASGCHWLASRLSLSAASLILLASVAVPAVLVMQGRLIVKTEPLSFIKGTHAYRTAKFLNKPGGPGFDFLNVLVEPVSGNIYNPEFIASMRGLQNDLRKDPKIREISSVIGTVEKISRETYGKPLPETPEEVRGAFSLMECNLPPTIQRQLWYEGGIRISVSGDMEEPGQMEAVRTAVMQAAGKYPALKAYPFGKVALYPQVDKEIVSGQAGNLVGSQWVIILICGLMIWLKGRSRGHPLSPVLGGLAMSVPFVFGGGLMCLTMIAFMIPLNVVTACIMALTINASVDFSIYFADAYHSALLKGSAPREALQVSMSHMGKTVVGDSILNTICFLPLLTSSSSPVRDMGWMMGVMLLFCCVGSLVLMPPFLVRASKTTPVVTSAG